MAVRRVCHKRWDQLVATVDFSVVTKPLKVWLHERVIAFSHLCLEDRWTPVLSIRRKQEYVYTLFLHNFFSFQSELSYRYGGVKHQGVNFVHRFSAILQLFSSILESDYPEKPHFESSNIQKVDAVESMCPMDHQMTRSSRGLYNTPPT